MQQSTFNLPLRKKTDHQTETIDVGVLFRDEGVELHFDGNKLGPALETDKMVTEFLQHFDLCHAETELSMNPALKELWCGWLNGELGGIEIQTKLNEIGKIPLHAPAITRFRPR